MQIMWKTIYRYFFVYVCCNYIRNIWWDLIIENFCLELYVEVATRMRYYTNILLGKNSVRSSVVYSVSVSYFNIGVWYGWNQFSNTWYRFLCIMFIFKSPKVHLRAYVVNTFMFQLVWFSTYQTPMLSPNFYNNAHKTVITIL
jgi:hypothetical protein